MANTRLHVRIGQHEFSAEGPVEIVQQQYADFLSHIPDAEQEISPRLSPRQLSHCYIHLPDGRWEVRQSALGGDVGRQKYLILHLYGGLMFEGETEISATDLIRALRLKGLVADDGRIDRLLDPLAGYVLKTGAKRGSKYRITQRGVEFAETVIQAAKTAKEK